MYCNASVYTVALRMRGRKYVRILSFLNYLQVRQVKRDMKHIPLPSRVTGFFHKFSISLKLPVQKWSYDTSDDSKFYLEQFFT